MKKSLFIFYFVAIISTLLSINYDRDPLSFTDDDEIFIQNCRNSISIKLDEGNSERIREIVRLISERFNDNLDVAFCTEELFVIGVECDSLSLILAANIYETGYLHCRGGRISYYDSYDSFSHKSTELMRENIEIYSKKIMQSNLTQEEIDFALLILDDDYRRDNYTSIDTTNARCEKFFENHPNSIYEKYIRDFIRLVIAPYKWGTGVTAYISYTQGCYKFDDFFNDDVSFQINSYFTHKNFVTSLMLRHDKLKSSKAFTRLDFKKDKKFHQNTLGIQFGNRIRSLQKLSFEPHIFLGYSYIDYIKKGDTKEFLASSPTTGIGFSLHYVVSKEDYSSQINPYSDGAYYISFSCDYYNNMYGLRYDDYNGGTLSLSLGFGYYIRSNIKEY